MNATLHNLFRAVLLTALTVTMPYAAHAQATGFGSAGWKQGVEGYWPAQASGRYIESARNYAQTVQTYVATNAKVELSVVKEIKTELGGYLDEAQKHLVAMKKDLATDTEAVATVESIEKELKTAIEQNREMIVCCENQKFDRIATMACCTDLVKQLDKVHADHVALMRKLSQKYPAAPATK